MFLQQIGDVSEEDLNPFPVAFVVEMDFPAGSLSDLKASSARKIIKA